MKRAVQVILILMTVVLWELGAGLADKIVTRLSPGDVPEATETTSLEPENAQPVPMAPEPRIQEEQKEEPQEEIPVDTEFTHFDVPIEALFFDGTAGSTTNYESLSYEALVTQLMSQPGLAWDPTNVLLDQVKNDLAIHYKNSNPNPFNVRVDWGEKSLWWAIDKEPNKYTAMKEAITQENQEYLAECNRSFDQKSVDSNIWSLDFYTRVDTRHQFKYRVDHIWGVPGLNRKILDAVKERNESLAPLHLMADGKITIQEYQLVEFVEWRFKARMELIDNEARAFYMMMPYIPKPKEDDRGLRPRIPEKVQNYWDALVSEAQHQSSLASQLKDGYASYDIYSDGN